MSCYTDPTKRHKGMKDPAIRAKALATRRANQAVLNSSQVTISGKEYKLLRRIQAAQQADNQLGIELNLLLQETPYHLRKMFKGANVISDLYKLLDELFERHQTDGLRNDKERKFMSDLAVGLLPNSHIGKRAKALAEFIEHQRQEAEEQAEAERKLDELFALLDDEE